MYLYQYLAPVPATGIIPIVLFTTLSLLPPFISPQQKTPRISGSAHLQVRVTAGKGKDLFLFQTES
jgi:hypothetical protein